jgi:hypothetical protein
MGFEQKMHGHCPQIFFTLAVPQWIQSVSPVPRIKHHNRATLAPIGGGEVEEISLHIVDDDGVGPGEKLADCQKSFAAACRRVNKHVSQLPSGWSASDAKETAGGSDA